MKGCSTRTEVLMPQYPRLKFVDISIFHFTPLHARLLVKTTLHCGG